MGRNRILVVHPTGNPNSSNLVLALRDAGLDCSVFTGIAYQRWMDRYSNRLPRYVRSIFEKEIERRKWFDIEGVKLSSFPAVELWRQLFLKSGLGRRWPSLSRKLLESSVRRLDSLAYKKIVTQAGKTFDVVYAYEDCAALVFEKCRMQNIPCILEQPSLFYKTRIKIMEEEFGTWPELKILSGQQEDPRWKIDRKEKEVALANRIYVPARLVAESLVAAGCPADKIEVIPYGAPVAYFTPAAKRDRIFRILYVGQVSPQKGVHYLLSAWAGLRIKNAELLLVGSDQFPLGWLKRNMGLGVRHIPNVPHMNLQDFYTSADVFVFPSLMEGLAMVILEAMACGIPVITTPNAGVADIIDEAREGFIVPIRDIEALKEKILWCYEHPEALAEMKIMARRKAEHFSWSLYRSRVVEKVADLINDGRRGAG